VNLSITLKILGLNFSTSIPILFLEIAMAAKGKEWVMEISASLGERKGSFFI
jgi:hypothetical protein